MTQISMPPADPPLLKLAAELLDAHVDTLELMLGWGDELRWQAHLDYLRALVRTTEEILAVALRVEARAARPARAATAAIPHPRSEGGR